VFVHGTDMVGLVDDSEAGKTEPPRLASFGEAALRGLLARTARWVKPPNPLALALLGLDPAEFDPPAEYPPREVVQDLLASFTKPLPRLVRLVHTPVFTAAEQLIAEPGYHRDSGIYYAPSRGLKPAPVPARPTAADVHRALETWDDVLHDFPLDGDYSRPHIFALALGVVARDLIEGATPLHLVAKHQPRTGAGLLTDVVLHPALGRWPGRATIERSSDSEMEKALLAVLRAGNEVFLFDNLRRTLSSASLSNAITTDRFEGRLLGESTWLRLPVRCLWCATGNNPRLSSELTGRSVRIGLDARAEHPEERSGFRHPRLRSYVRERWSDLVWANLVLVTDYLQASRPGPADDVPEFGMFEEWRWLMGGIADRYQLGKLLDDRAVLRADQDAERGVERSFCGLWWQAHATTAQAARDLLGFAESAGVELGESDRGQTIRLGRWLEQRAGQVIRTEFDAARLGPLVRMARGGLRDGRHTWLLEEVDETRSEYVVVTGDGRVGNNLTDLTPRGDPNSKTPPDGSEVGSEVGNLTPTSLPGRARADLKTGPEVRSVRLFPYRADTGDDHILCALCRRRPVTVADDFCDACQEIADHEPGAGLNADADADELLPPADDRGVELPW
jgi:hypothetical protein